MIRSITVTNHLNESLTLELGAPEKSGLLIQRMEGLGPSKATINSTEIATMDGARYNSSRVSSRNIVLSLALLPHPTVEDTRQMTYRYFPVNKQVKIEVEATNRSCYAYGYVETNEPDIFSSFETTQISIVCPDPYFYSSEGAIRVLFSGIKPMLEFPFSNECEGDAEGSSVIGDPDSPVLTAPVIRLEDREPASLEEENLVISEIAQLTSQTINYEGDADAGITLYIHAKGAAKGITVYNRISNERIIVDTDAIETITGAAFATDDEIVISTSKGSKSAQLLRKGSYSNIFNAVDKTSDWLTLSKGDNTIAFTAEEGEDNLELAVEYLLRYAGV